VPRDDLAFTVLVRGQVELGRVLQQGPQLLDHVLPALRQLPLRLEAVVDVHAEALGGEIGDMPDGGADVVAGAQMAGDGPGLGR
jgi:hypothetical protein